MAKNFKKDIQGILAFLHTAEKLKSVMRHAWLSSGRRESVAEHTWRMALMAVLCAPYLKKKVNLEKVLKMVLIHDLAEIFAKDHIAFKKIPQDRHITEFLALNKIVSPLNKNIQKEFISLWEDFDLCQSAEARLANAMDKMEVLLQHYEGPLQTLTKKEYKFNLAYGITQSEFDPFLQSIRKIINEEIIKFYKKNKVDKSLYA